MQNASSTLDQWSKAVVSGYNKDLIFVLVLQFDSCSTAFWLLIIRHRVNKVAVTLPISGYWHIY